MKFLSDYYVVCDHDNHYDIPMRKSVIKRTDVFVVILSERYFTNAWCTEGIRKTLENSLTNISLLELKASIEHKRRIVFLKSSNEKIPTQFTENHKIIEYMPEFISNAARALCEFIGPSDSIITKIGELPFEILDNLMTSSITKEDLDFSQMDDVFPGIHAKVTNNHFLNILNL